MQMNLQSPAAAVRCRATAPGSEGRYKPIYPVSPDYRPIMVSLPGSIFVQWKLKSGASFPHTPNLAVSIRGCRFNRLSRSVATSTPLGTPGMYATRKHWEVSTCLMIGSVTSTTLSIREVCA